MIFKKYPFSYLNILPNKSLVGDPKSGTFSCVSPCVGELIFIVSPGAGRHNSTVSRLIIFIFTQKIDQKRVME
jgi:hypothetical protein